MPQQTFVIVGASLAGAKAAQALREEGFDGRVVLVGEEDERPYERPPLSKGYLAGSAERETIFVHPQGWYADNHIELRTGMRVSAVTPETHEVVFADRSRERYDKLLLATGSTPRRLAVPGGDLDGVLYLRTVADSERIREAVQRHRRVVVVGAGWIGLEVAAAARGYGAEVTVVEPERAPLHRVLGPELGDVFARMHRDNGVDLRLGNGLQELRGSARTVQQVVLADGAVLDTPVVIVGVGINPRVELARGAGLAVENGIKVDASLRTSDGDIFAAGDVMNAFNPLLDRSLRVEHWANALNSGPAAARSMLGRPERYERVPYFFSDQFDLGMEYSGWAPAGSYDHVVFRGDPAHREFIAFWLSRGRVIAGMNVNVWDVVSPIQALIRSGQQVDPAQLVDPEAPLDELMEAS